MRQPIMVVQLLQQLDLPEIAGRQLNNCRDVYIDC
jgi:hypothetical protein